MTHPCLRAFLVANAVMLAACATDHGKHRYDFVVRVQSDPGQPLSGAQVLLGSQVLGTSNAAGKVLLARQAMEGEILSLSIRCPTGHRSPSKPISVVLRRAVDARVRPQYEVSCPPEKRTLVVAVRAENGPGLPIRHFGRELGRTDTTGAAHVVVEVPSEETIELTLDTSSNPRLRPSNPSARFSVAQNDDVVAFTQRFEVAGRRPGHSVRPSGPRGPIRIPTQ